MLIYNTPNVPSSSQIKIKYQLKLTIKQMFNRSLDRQENGNNCSLKMIVIKIAGHDPSDFYNGVTATLAIGCYRLK